MDRAQRRDLSSGSDGFEADVGGARGAGVGAVRMSRDKVARHLSILCMSIAWALSALHWLPATCHREKCFVLIPFTGLTSHKKRGFCLAEKNLDIFS